MDALVSAGKVRHVAASNTTADRLSEALAVSEKAGVARFVAVQPSYNLADRDPFERELLPLCLEEGLSCVPYFGLAQGFLTGKHRDAASAAGSVRGPRHGSTRAGPTRAPCWRPWTASPKATPSLPARWRWPGSPRSRP